MLKVLIVDDAPLLRERLRGRIAGIEGVEVVGEADTVRHALEEFGRLLPDVITLDIQLPDGSGIEVLEAVKKQRPETHVIVLTNYPLPQFRSRCHRSGAEYFFDKCGEFDRIPQVLRELGGLTNEV